MSSRSPESSIHRSWIAGPVRLSSKSTKWGPADVPCAWDEKFEKSFQLRPPSAALGCLQDIHWSMGGIGYFPTYTLGNLYAAQFMLQARQDLGDLDGDFRRGEFSRLRGWLNEKIHHQGHRFHAPDIR